MFVIYMCVPGEEIWLSGLRPSTVYLINVAAINDVGVGQSTQFAFTTDNMRQSLPLHFVSCLKARFHYAIWFEADSKPVADRFEAGRGPASSC